MLALVAALALATGAPPPESGVTLEEALIPMHDGVRLAADLWRPRDTPPGRRLTVLLEYLPYRKDEVLAGWKRISAPTLWVEGDETDPDRWWGHRYPRSDFEARLALVRDLRRVRLADCGHMLHFDQPDVLAATMESFLDADRASRLAHLCDDRIDLS